MKIIVTARAYSDLLDILKVFRRHSYKVIQHVPHQKTQTTYTWSFILSNDGYFQNLFENLDSIHNVIDVALVERDLEAEALENSFKERAQSLVDSYPDFVATLKAIDGSQDLNAESLFKIGQYVGKGLVAQGKIKPSQVNHLPRLLNKTILPVMRSFSIAKLKGDGLQILANPLCINKQSKEPSCHLLQGLIQGLLEAVIGTSAYTVHETRCKAAGAENCTFSILSTSKL